MSRHNGIALLLISPMVTGLVNAQIEARPDTRPPAANAHSAEPENTPMEGRLLGVTNGTRVQTSDGEQIGTVRNFVPDPRTGRLGYVLIARHSAPDTAVPYPAIFEAVHDGRIVLERSQLERAPAVRESQIKNSSNTEWQEQADEYWRASPSAAVSDKPRASIETPLKLKKPRL